MSPSSGKASGKTPRPPKDVMTALFFGEAVFSPSAQNALANYIAELEAELKLWREGRTTVEMELEAEVERLRAHLRWHDVCGTACPTTDYLEVERSVGRAFPIPRVNPSGEPLGGGGRESGDQGPGSVPGRPGRPAAANPAAPSLSARKATRKTDSCDGTIHTVVHADGNVCPFLVPRSP